MIRKIIYLATFLVVIAGCEKDETDPPVTQYPQKPSGKYDADPTVFMKSAIDMDLSNMTAKSVTLPMLQGWTANGEKTYYIITESSDFENAKSLGVNYSPIMKYAIGTQAVQNVTFDLVGKIKFMGTVDFSPVRVLIQGSPNAFPPSTAVPGSVGDANYSPLLVLPNGIVYNAPQVANNSGVQDRVLSINYDEMKVELLVSDGFYLGNQFFYHLVTDASDPVPATIENGIYAERLKHLPIFGKNTLADPSVNRGFALVANGETGINNPERQGLNSTIIDGGLEPNNVFQQDPQNDLANSNYSAMWDAHVYLWTDAAIAAGQRKRVKDLNQLKTLLDAGLVIPDPAAMGIVNPTIAGLKNNGLIINCAVISQPK
ncbi:MAG: hypothetical protein H0V01_07465 [Bacteroidetes bacterium]|nr:hypothetical protein [Bacteroidota bacterium]HET6244197.1 hypothetical protein [Bacteroidia bacterium]